MQKLMRRIRLYSYQSLMWILVWMTLVYQFAFGFILPYNNAVGETPLYGAMDFLVWIPQVWGIIGVALLAVMLVAIYTQNRVLTRIFSVGQVMLWGFAFAIYVQHGSLILAAGIALSMIIFWAWNMAGRESENEVMYNRIAENLDR